MFKTLLILFLFFFASCTNSYMVVNGKNGGKTVFKKQTPEFNKKYMEKQKLASNNRRANTINNDRNVNKNINFIKNENVRPINSTAYTEKSVLDEHAVVEEVIKNNNKLVESIIKEEPKKKTIEDFDYISQEVFEDPIIINKKEEKIIIEEEQNYIEEQNNKNNNIEPKKKKSWWKFWEKDKVVEDTNVIAEAEDKNETKEEIIPVDYEKLKLELEEIEKKNLRDFGSISEPQEGIENKLESEQVVKSEKNSSNETIELEVKEPKKKKSWWKFWEKDKDIEDTIVITEEKEEEKQEGREEEIKFENNENSNLEQVQEDIIDSNKEEQVQEENIETKVEEPKTKKSWWKFWEKDKTTEDTNVIAEVEDKNETKEEIIPVDYEKLKLELEEIEKKNLRDFGSISEPQEGIENKLESEQVKSEIDLENEKENNINKDNNEENIDKKNVDMKFVEIKKKKSWWKFWQRDKVVSEQESNSFSSLQYDNSNDVPRESGIIRDDENGTNENNSLEEKENVLEAKAISKNEYNKEIKDNNELLKETVKLVKGKYYVQIISTRKEESCRKLLKKYETKYGIANSIVYPVNLYGTMYYRGIIGPYDTKAEADLEKDEIINMGHYDVFIFKNK